MIANLSLRLRTVLAVLSGLSTWPVFYLQDKFEVLSPVRYAVTGGIFGLLVLVPFIATETRWYGRVAGLLLGSIVIYAFVVELAIDGYGPLGLEENVAVIVSGVGGALLVGALTSLLAPLRTSAKFWPYVLAAGALGGLVFSLLFESDYELVVSLGYVTWQALVFAALHWGSR